MEDVVFNQTTDFPEDEGHVSNVHIRVQQRRGRKCVTTIAGLAEDLDLKKILKYVKKMYNTNGTVVDDEEAGEVIQIQGDQRDNMKKFLTTFNICKKTEITIHGF